jgi:hypothetical protein
LEKQAPEAIRQAAREVDRLRRQREALWESIPTTMVMEEMPRPRETHVLQRGVDDKPGEKVFPGVPGVLSPLPPGVPNNRLGLARWLVDPANPLTARVAVNRWWQMYFGTGLMQTSVPELTDTSREPQHVFDLYGPEARKPGTFAANCLLARRLAERGVGFIQLFHRGWDQHTNLPRAIRGQCRDTDQPSAALVQDLKQRGLLEDTLVLWGGEFGRTIYCQGTLTAEDYGRDHHPRCFTVWLAGGGIKPGHTHGETDDYCYNVVKDPVHVHDLNATVLHCLGIEHTRLTYKYQGRDFRLTDVHGNVVHQLLA